MSKVAPEFSRLVPLHQLGARPYRQRIEATAEECERLARRFDLLSLARLSADVELRRQREQTVFLEATFEAEFEQCCAVTLEPVRGAVADRFSLIYGPAADQVEEIVIGGDEPAFEPLHGDSIDIGEALAQELSLALPAFPRHPDAVLEDMASAEPLEGPFAVLARLAEEKAC
jgi:uncharacterized metal-binding protein YceD (DUF177 family)